MRGFRWQALAFVFAVIVFGVTWVTRTPPEPTQPPTAIATATETASETPTPQPTTTTPGEILLPTSTPMFIPTPDANPLDLVTFEEGLVGDVRRLNPLLAGANPAERTVSALIFEGLVQTNIYGEPEPDLARRWVIASNRIEYVFELREDVLWQDGTPFTARDVEFTVDLLRSPDFPGDPELAAFWRTVETQVLDDHLIRFRLTQPLGSFLDALRVGILPEHALRGTNAADLPAHPFNLSPVGTGPYQLEAIRTADGSRITNIDLVTAPAHRPRLNEGEQPTIERVRFKLYPTFDEALAAFSAGEIDGLATQDSSQRDALISQEGAAIHTKLEPTLGTLIFNWQRPTDEDAPPNVFREERIRDALALGLDRRDAVERSLLNRAVVAQGPLLPGLWAYSPATLPSTDREAAREQLRIATQSTTDEESQQPYLTFSILTPDTPASVRLAEEIAGQWSQLNLDVTVETVPQATYLERLDAGDFDTALVELSLGTSADPDVYSFWHQGQFPDGSNYGAVDDRQISETLERARRDPYGLNRIEHYRAFQQVFIEKAVAIPLYHPLYTYAVKDRVEGVQIGFIGDTADRLRTLSEWVVPRS